MTAESRELLPGCTGVLALADGTILQGIGVGAVGSFWANGRVGSESRKPGQCAHIARLEQWEHP